jgi:hypothetical protein
MGTRQQLASLRAWGKLDNRRPPARETINHAACVAIAEPSRGPARASEPECVISQHQHQHGTILGTIVIIYLFNLNFGLVGFGFRDDLGAGEGEAHRIHVGGASPSLTPGAGSWSGLGLGPRLNETLCRVVLRGYLC